MSKFKRLFPNLSRWLTARDRSPEGSLEREFADLATELQLPLVRVDEIVRIHFEQDWREFFDIDQFRPVFVETDEGGVVFATEPPEYSLSTQYGRVPIVMQGPWAVVLMQHAPGESTLGGDLPDEVGRAMERSQVSVSCDAVLYRWRPPDLGSDQRTAEMWMAAAWQYHVGEDGRMLRLPGPGRGAGPDHPAFYLRTPWDELRQMLREGGLNVADELLVDPDVITGSHLTPMLRALAMWNTGQAVDVRGWLLVQGQDE